MKKEYIKPIMKFHVLKFNRVMVASEEELQPAKFRMEQADEWSD